MEFIFVMESEEDPAYEAASTFKKSMEGSVSIKVVVAGLSYYSSQKIHNLLVGVAQCSSDSEYVLLLDDDAEMSSAILRDLVACLRNDPRVLVASGWPHEYVAPDCPRVSCAGYMLLGYRLLSYLGIASEHTKVLWGGCLLLRRADLVSPKVGILEAWRNSGYSDDMIVGGRAHRLGMFISIPPKAILPARLDPSYSVARHWNYVRRQMFVLDTYADKHDRNVNLFLLVVVSIGGLVFSCLNMQVFAVFSFLSLVCRLAYPEARSAMVERLSTQWSNSPACGLVYAPPEALLLVSIFMCTCAFLCGLLAASGITGMCEKVSARPKSYTHRLNPLVYAVGTFLGLAAQCIMQASAACIALISNRVVWSGVHYVKKGGKVHEVWRTDSAGRLHTVPWHKSLEIHQKL